MSKCRKLCLGAFFACCVIGSVLYALSWFNKIVHAEQDAWITMQIFMFVVDKNRLPVDVPEFVQYVSCTESITSTNELESELKELFAFSKANVFDIESRVQDFLILKNHDVRRQRRINERLATLLRMICKNACTQENMQHEESPIVAECLSSNIVFSNNPNNPSLTSRFAVPANEFSLALPVLSGKQYAGTEQYASDLNDVMDEMLNRSEIPADYAETMVAVFRDKSLGDVVRDFAVQHIGLYAEKLNMRGKYNADSNESAALRDSLWDAADETHTIVAAAAFRALADMAAFDPHIDAKRLDNQLASCVADSSASPAARVLAAQLCGERRVVAAKPVLARIAADRSQPEPLRLAAANSARSLAE